MGNKFYLHINSANLANYFGCACIKPSKYFIGGRTEDIQSAVSDYLILSNVKRTKKADCSIELILTDDEVH